MERQWWHDKVFYQIYPKSFYDTNEDGIGDIQGIIAKLDYLKDLGIDIIWISPIYPSPFADQGYDVADYYGIDPAFGTMDDFDTLLVEAKNRDMHILMDLVINHCSDEHEWFQKALADLDGEYAKYFYIADAKPDGSPPSNLRSYFGGSAWEKIEGTNRYYLHMYAKKQPDLNWENPVVVAKLYKMVNWWLEKGLAGFRIDAIVNIKKDLPFRDYPTNRLDHLANPEEMLHRAIGVVGMLQDLKEQTFDKHDAIAVAEMFEYNPEKLGDYIGAEGCFSAIFDFDTSLIGSSAKGWYDAKKPTANEYKKVFFKNQLAAQKIGLMCNIIENHDQPRGVSRYLPENACNDTSKKMLATILMMSRGLPFIYQGQEIGMENNVYENINEIDDVYTIGEYDIALQSGLSEQKALNAVSRYCRDNARSPMQWSAENNSGFTQGTPWMKPNKKYKDINVAHQLQDENSVFHYYKKLISLRKGIYKNALTTGQIIPVYEKEDNVLAFMRTDDTYTLLTISNYQDKPIQLAFPYTDYKFLLNNCSEIVISHDKLQLAPYQAVVIALLQEVAT